jgi:hypothetical protein
VNKNTILIIGFILFFLGALSIILSIVGLKLDILSFLNKVGTGFAFLVQIILLFGGVAMIYVAKNIDRED